MDEAGRAGAAAPEPASPEHTPAKQRMAGRIDAGAQAFDSPWGTPSPEAAGRVPVVGSERGAAAAEGGPAAAAPAVVTPPAARAAGPAGAAAAAGDAEAAAQGSPRTPGSQAQPAAEACTAALDAARAALHDGDIRKAKCHIGTALQQLDRASNVAGARAVVLQTCINQIGAACTQLRQRQAGLRLLLSLEIKAGQCQAYLTEMAGAAELKASVREALRQVLGAPSGSAGAAPHGGASAAAQEGAADAASAVPSHQLSACIASLKKQLERVETVNASPQRQAAADLPTLAPLAQGLCDLLMQCLGDATTVAQNTAECANAMQALPLQPPPPLPPPRSGASAAAGGSSSGAVAVESAAAGGNTPTKKHHKFISLGVHEQTAGVSTSLKGAKMLLKDLCTWPEINPHAPRSRGDQDAEAARALIRNLRLICKDLKKRAQTGPTGEQVAATVRTTTAAAAEETAAAEKAAAGAAHAAAAGPAPAQPPPLQGPWAQGGQQQQQEGNPLAGAAADEQAQN
ncbi:hypothetical protein HYH03_014805 [Edaphochlamys debaryana]|uniref:Uncharacterized protein n=1 Tax=Edaphochlamys debaryana TaxID=47281 RepID=A0A835XPD3_9CHLO|nr:hypothetical protein HYH03_014805 [Edaphochlamys debaryana]|eukprot:KAG2486503.1 hypothetical protein HYH03_014805 [Edaphochlamys debaryana]